MTAPAARPAVNPWVIAVVVTVPTFMEVLDTSVANVAVRYIAGGLSAAETDSEWVITSYLASNAIILPVSGWLSNHLGRKRYFILSLAGFTASSFLCGIATSLPELILFRVLQGFSGGGLQPSTQGVLLDTFPPEKRGPAMSLFGVAVLVAPILGPTLGGYITDNYSWRWLFFINIPVGILAVALCAWLLDDPEYLKRQRAELLARPIRFDAVGLGLVAVGIACLEVVLSKGQEWDWLGDPFRRVQVLLAGVVLGLGGLVWWELRHPAPVVDLRPLADRNFAASSLIVFLTYGVLYGSITSLPGMLETLLGYDATYAGLVLSPGGLASMAAMPVIGGLLGRGADARRLIIFGALALAAGCYWFSRLNLDIGPWQVIWPRVVQSVGTGFLFVPLSVAAYVTLPADRRAAAVGLFALFRNEGGSVGTSVANTLVQRREQFHALRLGENIDPLNPAVGDYLGAAQPYFQQLTGDPVGSQVMAWQVIDTTRLQQALSLSYFDCFWAFALLSLLLVPFALLMRRAVAEPGAHVGAE